MHGCLAVSGSFGPLTDESSCRLAPRQLEDRDKLFSKLMAQVQAMVEADHEHRPAVIVAFSLGCRIAKVLFPH